MCDKSMHINYKIPIYTLLATGPPVHPLFGNFLTLSSLDPVPYKAWHTLTQTFGPIVRLVMGPTTMVRWTMCSTISRYINETT